MAILLGALPVPLPGPDRPYVTAPFLGILVTLPVQLLAGPLGLLPAQTALVALMTAGLVGASFGALYAGRTASATSLSASLSAGGAVLVLLVAGTL